MKTFPTPPAEFQLRTSRHLHMVVLSAGQRCQRGRAIFRHSGLWQTMRIFMVSGLSRGEIDCMEVMGQETNKAYGTIHYGNPHAESQGTYYTSDDEADFSDDFHTFTCDWEPGVIKWYVDGKLYHEESDWHSTTQGRGLLRIRHHLISRFILF